MLPDMATIMKVPGNVCSDLGKQNNIDEALSSSDLLTIPLVADDELASVLPDVEAVLNRPELFNKDANAHNSLKNFDMYDFAANGENLESLLGHGEPVSSASTSSVTSSTYSTVQSCFPSGTVSVLYAVPKGSGIQNNMPLSVLPVNVGPRIPQPGQAMLAAANGNLMLTPLVDWKLAGLQLPANFRVLPCTNNNVNVSVNSSIRAPLIQAVPHRSSFSVPLSTAELRPMVNNTVMRLKSLPHEQSGLMKAGNGSVKPVPVEKDGQEYERVMDILKKYRTEIAERCVEATMPCKRRKSRPLVASPEPVKPVKIPKFTGSFGNTIAGNTGNVFGLPPAFSANDVIKSSSDTLVVCREQAFNAARLFRLPNAQGKLVHDGSLHVTNGNSTVPPDASLHSDSLDSSSQLAEDKSSNCSTTLCQSVSSSPSVCKGTDTPVYRVTDEKAKMQEVLPCDCIETGERLF